MKPNPFKKKSIVKKMDAIDQEKYQRVQSTYISRLDLMHLDKILENW